MRPLGRLVRLLVLLAMLVLPGAPGLASVATIEATAPLADHSERSIKTAMVEAVRAAVRTAIAMGFTWVAFGWAEVRGNQLTVQILATTTDPEGEEEGVPGAGDGEAASFRGPPAPRL